jgi:hypothetical protein
VPELTDAEVKRAWEAHDVAYRLAMANGQEVNRLRRELRNAADTLHSIGQWRKEAHAHDLDVATEPRDFLDEEDWDNLETYAERHAKRAREALENPS